MQKQKYNSDETSILACCDWNKDWNKFSSFAVAVTLSLIASVLIRPNPATAQEDSALKTMVAMEKVVIDAIDKAENSVVAIARVRKGNIGDPTDPNFVPNEYGTGVVIGKNKIVTTYHLLGDPKVNDYYVWIQRKPFKVSNVLRDTKVTAADSWTDLAVLEVKTGELEPIKFGKVDKLRKGQIVIALGNPYAIARDGEASATWGIISNLLRKSSIGATEKVAPRAAETIHEYGTLIQTDAKLNFGTSGGALLNLKGEMIGLTTALVATHQYEQAAGFAIPVDDTFLKTIEALKQGKLPEFGFLGIGPGDLSPEARARGQSGIRVNRVVAGSPAADAKIAFGDIVTQIDGEEIFDSSQFMRALVGRSVNEELEIKLKRRTFSPTEFENVSLNVKLAKRFVTTVRKSYSMLAPEIWRGLQVDYATAIPDFSELAYAMDKKGCIAVTSVTRGSPAWKAGLRPRTFISHVENQRVRTPADFFKTIQEKSGEVSIKTTDLETPTLKVGIE